MFRFNFIIKSYDQYICVSFSITHQIQGAHLLKYDLLKYESSQLLTNTHQKRLILSASCYNLPFRKQVKLLHYPIEYRSNALVNASVLNLVLCHRTKGINGIMLYVSAKYTTIFYHYWWPLCDFNRACFTIELLIISLSNYLVHETNFIGIFVFYIHFEWLFKRI